MNYCFLLCLLLAIQYVYAEFNPTEYMCSICINILKEINIPQANYQDLCSHYNVCSQFNESFITANTIVSSDSNDIFRIKCERANYCSKDEQYLSYQSKTSSDALNLRISKGYGARGNDKIRVSVISNSSLLEKNSNIFTYSEPFKYRWTQYYLNTGIIEVVPGTNTELMIENERVNVYVPKANEGTRGVIIADPCFQTQWVSCMYKDTFQTFTRMTSLLNAINSHSDTHYWMILGDNFYDQTGYATDSWFSALSLQTKSKIIGSVPGNHDYWVHGAPSAYVPGEDQLGNGYMQFYGQDVAASYENYIQNNNSDINSIPYNFIINPDQSKVNSLTELLINNINNQNVLKNAESSLAALNNFFYYNQIGNVGFIGYSGAYSYVDTIKYFEEACNWAVDNDEDMSAIVLIGHWNFPGDGCDAQMDVPDAYREIIKLDACKPIASKFRYFEGHTHCNKVIMNDIGYMVAGQGMSGCGNFGFPIVDSTNNQFNVYYFPISQIDNNIITVDNYDEILSCIQTNGVSNCYHLAELWSTTPL